jgi:hypothetical protein
MTKFNSKVFAKSHPEVVTSFRTGERHVWLATDGVRIGKGSTEERALSDLRLKLEGSSLGAEKVEK